MSPAVCLITSMKVLFQRREFRVKTALLSMPRRGHVILTHFAPLPQDCQQRREHSYHGDSELLFANVHNI